MESQTLISYPHLPVAADQTVLGEENLGVVLPLGIQGEVAETENSEVVHLGEERGDHLAGGRAFRAKEARPEMVASAYLVLRVLVSVSVLLMEVLRRRSCAYEESFLDHRASRQA
jgi:hypothetical protein